MAASVATTMATSRATARSSNRIVSSATRNPRRSKEDDRPSSGMRKNVPRWSIAIVVAALGVPAAARQTFRGSAELVSVYATVTDNEAHLITDLTKEDFVVSDEG